MSIEIIEAIVGGMVVPFRTKFKTAVKPLYFVKTHGNPAATTTVFYFRSGGYFVNT